MEVLFPHAWVDLCRCPMMEGSDYPQSAVSPQSMDCVLTSEGLTRARTHTHSVWINFKTSRSLIPFFLCLLRFGRWRKAGAADGAGHPRRYKSRSWKNWTHDRRGGDGDPEVKYSFPGPTFLKLLCP